MEIMSAHADPYGPFFGSYAFMSFSKVCHSWRDLSLTSPMLWKQISTRYPSAALVALERSTDSGFYLVIPDGTRSEIATPVLEAVAKEAHRLRRLYLPSDILKRSDGSIHPMLLPLTNSSAPLLETLETVKMRGDGSCVQLPVLFAGNTPQLRCLRIQYMWPSVQGLTLANLRELSFCGKKRMQISLSISSLLDLLEASPLLELLHIAKVEWQPAEEGDTRRVNLEHLRSIDLGPTSASTTSEIISRLDTPECALRLKVWLERYDDSKFHVGVPPEHELLAEHYLHHVRKMHVEFLSGYDAVMIHGATATLPFEIRCVLEGGTVQNLGDMDAIAATVFQAVVNAFDLTDLEEFALTEMRSNTRWTGFTRQVWTSMFCRMPNLRTFHITMDSCYDEGFSRSILSALSSPEQLSGHVLCPGLEDLFVVGDKTWSSLQCYTLAEERHNRGHPLKRVSMRLPHYASFANPDDTDLPLLRKYVPKVDLEPEDIAFPDWPDTQLTV